MKKITIIVMMAALLLTGCAKGVEPQSQQSSTETNSNSLDSGSEAIQPQSPVSESADAPEGKTSLSFKLCGPEGDEIFQEDITSFSPMEDGTALSELNADNWFSIECDGFAYLAEPTGISMNSVQNTDIYDTENWSFKDEPERSPAKYKRAYVGEEFMGLKVTGASCVFNLNNSGLEADEKYFAGCDVAFEGELTMTGYACMAPEDDGYTVKHDISFVPDNESCLLPVMLFQISEKGIYSPVYKCGTADFAWRNEYPGTVNAGNADYEGYKDLDFGFFPEDGSYVPVKITINNITMRSYPDFISTIEAQIVDIEPK